MPYIPPDRREEIWNGVDRPKTSGELNFILTQEVLRYIQTKGESYSTFNDVMGALEGCKLEFYRRKVVPYEDKKIAQNGDIDEYSN